MHVDFVYARMFVNTLRKCPIFWVLHTTRGTNYVYGWGCCVCVYVLVFMACPGKSRPCFFFRFLGLYEMLMAVKSYRLWCQPLFVGRLDNTFAILASTGSIWIHFALNARRKHSDVRRCGARRAVAIHHKRSGTVCCAFRIRVLRRYDVVHDRRKNGATTQTR